MKTKIIINPNDTPFIPKYVVLKKHVKMPISTFYREFFNLMELDEIEGPFIWHEGYINLNTCVMDHFLSHPEDAPEKIKKSGVPIYFMDTLYSTEGKDLENAAWEQVRSMRYDKEEEKFKEHTTKSYHSEFYNGTALLYNMEKHTAYEMKKLQANVGKAVRIFTTELGKDSLAEYMPDGYVATLEKVEPGKGIYTFKKEKIIVTEETHGIFPFIGPKDGIIKVVLEETGEILYENLTLAYPKDMNNEERLKHVNRLRKIKYGTEEHSLTKLPLI